MAVRLVVGVQLGTDEGRAVMYDDATGTAFGPVFESPAEAEDFLAWLAADCPGRPPEDLSPAEVRAAAERWAPVAERLKAERLARSRAETAAQRAWLAGRQRGGG